MSRTMLPGAGPFYFDGNNIGILFLHGGGGGTCADLKSLAEDLHKKGGYTIKIPLLPGYGTTPEDLRSTPINAWKDFIEREIEILKQKCNKIIVGGHSMGGILTLIFASKHNFDGIFTISAPSGIKIFGIKLVPLIKPFLKFYKLPDVDKMREETGGKWVGYDRIPLNIVSKINKLMKEMKSVLSKITSPAILFQGRLDSYIKDDSMDFIYEKVNSKKKKRIWLENNDHPILDSPDHNQIVSELNKFISEI